MPNGSVRNALELGRSVLPHEFSQIWFLAGTTCLFITGLLPWGPKIVVHTQPPLSAIVIQLCGQLFILFAGSAGFLLCFWVAGRPIRQLLLTVCLPAFIGLSVESGFYSSVGGTGQFSIVTVQSFAHVAKTSVAFHYALIGIFLIAAFTFRVRYGSASLPLALPLTNLVSSDTVPWNRLKILVWLTVVWFPFLWFSAPVHLALAHIPVIAALLSSTWVAWVQSYLLPFGIWIVLAACLLGNDVWRTLWRSVRLPWPEMFLVGFALSVGVVVIGLMIDQYCFGLAVTPARSAAPYGVFVSALLVSALFEEVMFRGLLQPWFISRYGVLRGILLVSAVWAGGHLWGDFSTIVTDKEVLLQLGGRFVVCVGMGLVLGWLALRSRSVLPGVLAHATYNCFAVPMRKPQGGLYFVPMFVLWLLASFLLFGCWPIQEDRSVRPVTQPVAHSSEGD
jgi:membrane protease YdiL (CAAX protease family)